MTGRKKSANEEVANKMILMTIAMTKDGGAQKDVGRTDGQCRTIARFVGLTKKVISSSAPVAKR